MDGRVRSLGHWGGWEHNSLTALQMDSWRNELDSLLPLVSRAQWFTSPLGLLHTQRCIHTQDDKMIYQGKYTLDLTWFDNIWHKTWTYYDCFDCFKPSWLITTKNDWAFLPSEQLPHGKCCSCNWKITALNNWLPFQGTPLSKSAPYKGSDFFNAVLTH